MSIKDFLAHSSISATKIYTTHIREQIEKGNVDLNITKNYSDDEKKNLLKWSKNYVK